MRKMKDSGVEWIGEIPEEWQIWRLKHLAQIQLQYGANQSGVDYSEDFPRYIRITDITQDNKLRDEEKLSLTNEQSKGYILNDGDVLFARSGATAGKSFYYTSDMGKSAFAGYLIRFQAKSEIILSKLVYYYTLSRAYSEWKNQIFIQATIQNISADKYNNLSVAVPPTLTAQKVVIDYLDRKCAEIDSILKAKETTNEKLREYRQSVIYEAVTKGLDKNAKMKDSGDEWIRNIPEQWGTSKIKYLLSEESDSMRIGPFGSSLSGTVIHQEGDYKVYGQENLIADDFFVGDKYVSDEKYEELKAYTLRPNDITISMMGTIGKCSIVPDQIEPGIMDSHLIRIRLNSNKIISNFFKYAFSADSSVEQLNCYSKGSIMNGLNSAIIKSIDLTTPKIEVQIKIVDYLDHKCAEIDSVISANEQIIEKLKEYRQSVIYEVVTGKVEV